jgi:hypothetical protein
MKKFGYFASVHGDDKSENSVIRIGIEENGYNDNDEMLYDLYASNDEDVQCGGVSTIKEAIEMINMA